MHSSLNMLIGQQLTKPVLLAVVSRQYMLCAMQHARGH
jgi:hypothetical protein